MRLLLLTSCLLALAVTSVAGLTDPEDRDIEHKYKMVVNEVGDLRYAMKTMQEDMKRIKQVSRALDVLCRELHSGEEIQNPNPPGTKLSVEETQGDTDTEDKGEYKAPIQVTYVLINNGTFQVEYNSTVKADVKSIGMSPKRPEDVFDVNFNNSFSIGKGIVSGESNREVSLYLREGDGYGSSLTFDSFQQLNESFLLLKFFTDIKGDIVFEPNTSTTLKVKLDKSKHEYDLSCSTYTIAMGTNNSESIIYTWGGYPGIINKTEWKEYLHFNEVTFVINEEKDDFEGIVFLKTEVRTRPRTRLYVEVGQTIIVRRSDHRQPFPDGFCGFVEVKFGDLNIECDIGTMCTTSVDIVAENSETVDVSLWKLNDGGRSEIRIPRERLSLSYILSSQFYFFNVSKADAGRYMYRCTSRAGKVIMKEFEMKVTLLFTILKENSHVLEDSSETLVVICEGRGYPNPEIRFRASERESHWIKEKPGVTIKSHLVKENDVITAILTIDKQQLSVNQILCSVTENEREDISGEEYQVYKKG